MLKLGLALILAAAPNISKAPKRALDPNTLYAMHWDRPAHLSCDAVDMNKSFDNVMSFLDKTPQTNGRVYNWVQGKHFAFVIVFVEHSGGRRRFYSRVLASDRAYCLAKHARLKEEAKALEKAVEIPDFSFLLDVTDELIGRRPPLGSPPPRS